MGYIKIVQREDGLQAAMAGFMTKLKADLNPKMQSMIQKFQRQGAE